MNKLTTIFLTAIIAIGLTIVTYAVLTKNPATGGEVSRKCETYSSTAATVGADISSTVVAAYSNRAYARIQVVDNATSTISLSFDEGEDATLGTGIILYASTSTPFVEFGLNTDFPYVGEVTGITSVGSTTVQVVECRY